MRKVKVSVIIPVYNTEKYLEKCLYSVCNQTLSDIEIICINDCSTDNSREILNKYAADDERIKIINFEENKGAAAARNAGIDAATGEYIGFVDADDYPDLDFYEKLYNKAQETGADIVKGDYKYAHNDYVEQYLNKKIKEDKNNFCAAYCSAIFKSDLIKENCIQFPLITDMEDPVFAVIAAYYANKIEIIDNLFINIVKHENSVTAGVPDFAKIKDKFTGLNLIFEHLNSSNVTADCYGYVLGCWFVDVIRDSLRNTNFLLCEFVEKKALDIFLKVKYKEQFKQYVEKDAPAIYKFFENKKEIYFFDINKLKNLIDNHDVISFDIFDTLLLRPFLLPTDLFAYLGQQENVPEFCTIRQLEEKKARMRIRLKNKNYEDVTYDEIYASLLNKNYSKFKELELNLEKETLTQNQEIYEVYQYALSKNKKIIITSDMYLSKDFLKEVLAINGYDKYFKLYVSSEIRKTKSSGALYKYIIDDLGVNANQILHIGDNYNSDIVNANKSGISTFYYKMLRERYFANITNIANKQFCEENKNNPFNIAINLQVLNATNPKNDNYWYKWGYQLGGPLVLAFTQAVIDIVEARGLTDLFFVARDGYILNKVYPLLKKNCKAKNHYVYAQRKLSKLCLENSDEYNEISANEYQKYINSLPLDGAKIGVIDSCTNTFSAQKLIENFLPDKNIIGIYLAVDLNYKYNYINLFSKSGGTVEFNWDIIELLLTSTENPVIDIANCQPVFLNTLTTDEIKRQEIFKLIADGELDFVYNYIKYMKNKKFSFQTDNVYKYLTYYWQNLSSTDKYYLSQVKHASNVEQSNYKTLLYSSGAHLNKTKELVSV